MVGGGRYIVESLHRYIVGALRFPFAIRRSTFAISLIPHSALRTPHFRG